MSTSEERIKLPTTESISRCYQPQGNRKVIRILTVAVYVLCVSLAAIMLSLYYIFIWDPTIHPFIRRTANCEKIVIPERIAIRLINSTDVTAEQFYKHILRQYRLLYELQLQRQQFLKNQREKLQLLAATENKFQDVFATATIIQTNAKHGNNPVINHINNHVTQTDNASMTLQTRLQSNPKRIPLSIVDHMQSEGTAHEGRLLDTMPILDAAPVYIASRRSHRKHNQHHHSRNRNFYKRQEDASKTNIENKKYADTALNPPTSIIQEFMYTSLPIPLILNSDEDHQYSHIRTHTHLNAHKHRYNNKRNNSKNNNNKSIGNSKNFPTTTRIHRGNNITSASGYVVEQPNSFLNSELVFEK